MKKNEKLEHFDCDPEVYANELVYFLQQFKDEYDIDDLRTASQSVWNGALRYIYKNVFRGTDKLKSNSLDYNSTSCTATNYGAYDYNKVMYILDIYIDICMIYDKEISIVGFSNLTGIESYTINLWSNDKPSSPRFAIYQKIIENREESLSNKLATGNKNPVGILAILNRHYQWNLPGVSKEPAKPAALSASELPRLGSGIVQNIQNALLDDLETVE